MAQQEITKEQLEQIKAECTPSVSTSTRQVPGGYIITGQVQWAKDGVVQAVQRDEAVCMHANNIGSWLNMYHDTFGFNGYSVKQETMRDILERSFAEDNKRVQEPATGPVGSRFKPEGFA